MAKAQAELDVIVGPDRLPDFSDKDQLPYVNAIIAEAFRWHNVFPMGIQHCTLEDDEFHGFFIPAGTVILASVWYVEHMFTGMRNPI